MKNKQQKVIDETVRIWMLSCEMFNIKANIPEIKFSNRYTSIVATANADDYTITYSNRYIVADDDFIKRTTIKHEVAHLISFIIHGWDGFNHGSKWKKIMHELGVENPLAINDDIKQLPTKKLCYEYVCEQCGRNYFISRNRHVQYANYIIMLSCKYCRNKKIRFVDKVD